FINGDNIAITNAGRSITIGTSRDVSFDKVTVGGVVIDKNNGIDAGGKEITNVGPATSGNSAVNKTQMDTAIANAQTAATSTEKVVAKTLTGDTNLVTVTGQTGTAKGETYEVAVSENAVKAVAQTAAQDAVKVTGTGLANVTDSTTGGVKTYNVDVKTGNLVVTAAGQAGAAGTTGAGGAAGADGVATTQNVASAINDAITKSKTDTAQAIANAEHKFDGDTGATSVRKHGEVLSIKGGVTNTADLTTGNIGVVSDGAGTLNIRLAKTLTGLTSAAFTDGTHTVTIAGSGIDAGNTEIKHVGKATTDDAAVNKKQMDDAVKAATDSVTTLGDNKVSLGSDSGTTTAKKLSTTGGIKFNIKGDTGANALITTSATGDDVTIAPTAKLSAAVTAAENSANKDLSNLSTAGNTYIQNLAKSAASWNVETNGAGTTAVAGGDTVNFINGDNIAITNTGRSITIGTAKNVSFDKVTVGGVVIDKNNGIDAGGKEITNVGPATSGNSAVNKIQMDTAITNAVNKATTDAKHDFGGDDTTVVTRKHGEKLNIKGGASTTAADLTSGNIAVLGDAATGTLNIRMAKALTGLSSATFTTPSGTTVINGGGMTITPSTTGAAPISITTGGINAGNTEIKNVAAGTTPNSAVNKQQMDSAISNATANVGFHTAGNTGTGSVSNGQTLTITGTNGIETNASGQSITVGLDAATRAQINNATTTANNAAKKDLSNIDNAGKQVIKDTAAWNVKVNSGTPEIVKGGDTVTFKDGDNIKVTNTGKDITIATKKDVSFDKVTVGNVVIDKNTNRISGLANAANNDEAVNLGQMNAAISTATAGTGNIKYKANGGTQNSVALTTGFDFKGDSNIQITADPANSGVINYKLNPALTGITSISGGTGAPTITLNAGSGSTPGNVSINSNLDMGGKQINNIGAATHAGDAVNKAQMDQALQNIAGASSNVAKSYAYKAGAGAAALAALKPIQYDPLEPTQIMAGIGNYKSQTAVALGVAHYTNENTMFNLGVSLDSHDGIVNAGVTHKFGYSPEKKAIPDKYKGGPISSIYVMQDEVTALQAIVQKQAAENEALRQQNEDMQRKVDMILSKIH
ncbi:MAG: YadA-like family protein, partial [Veillonella sp.]|uniref:YadA-like family protein n=1 Tax=Veillonella sp. TaxID=1926307 RepID=UPI00290C89CE